MLYAAGMNGAQDLGGMMGFGPVKPEPDEPFFHDAWERRALAITLAMGATGSWTIDESRHARETLHPGDYLSSSYYEIWIKGLEKLLLAHDLVTQGELAGMESPLVRHPVKRVAAAADVPAMLAAGTTYDRPVTRPAAFTPGESVIVRNAHPGGHTRAPRYVRGRRGTIEAAHGMFVLPDTHAHGEGENPAWLYTVSFTGPELWGEAADPSLTVKADLWEPYLDAA